jgi:hypothetical protein
VADALEHESKNLRSRLGRWLSEMADDDRADVRRLVMREGRQGAVLSETGVSLNPLWGAGLCALNGLAAAGALHHGAGLLRDREPLHKIEGVNEILMGLGCALVAGNLAGGAPLLAQLGGHLLVAHGLGQAGLGLYSIGAGTETPTRGLLQAAHGLCLVGAELCPGIALPLCVAMLGLTGSQIYLAAAHSRE